MEQDPSFNTEVAQLVKKFLSLYKLMVQCYVHKSLLLDPILSHMNPIHIPKPCFSEIYFNIILPFTPQSPKWPLPFRLSD